MIKLDRPTNIPQVLQDNAQEWTRNLLALVQEYGTYKAIPSKIKEAALQHYRHKDIKSILFESTYRKCAFCEGFPEDNGNIEVEHFHPKSLYPAEAFSWENFLPCCRKCNGAKDAHDTKNEPIINPFINNPEDHLAISSSLRVIGKDEIGSKTIEVCGLKGTRIYRPYSELLVQFLQYDDDLTAVLQEYSLKNTPTTKRNQLVKIKESIERLEGLMNKKSKYSFFCSSFILSSESYKAAKSLISISSED